MSNRYKDALDVQDACNLRAIARLLVRVADEAADAGGTQASYDDAAVILVVSKINSLVNADDTKRFADAYDRCTMNSAGRRDLTSALYGARQGRPMERQMDKADKEKFIRSLCDSVRDDTIGRIKHMPETWDGMELREYLAREFEKECFLSRNPKTNRRRLQDFRNAVAVMFGL